MLRFFSRACGCAALLTLVGSSAWAFNGTPSKPSDAVFGPNQTRAVLTGDSYTCFTGLATSSSFVLTESTTTPTADDRVVFDGLPELINNSFDGTATPTVVRTWTESDTDNGNGTRTMHTQVTATGDLWPTGLASGGQPLVRGGFAVGLVLPASINGGAGSEGMAWDGATILQADMDITDGTGTGNTGPLPLGTFFNSTTAWNGVFGVIFSDSTSPTGVTGFNTTMIRLNVTYAVPEPASMALLLPLAGVALKRRRSH